MSQPTFKSSPPGLTEPGTIHSQSVHCLPSLSLVPLLEGELCRSVVLSFEIMEGGWKNWRSIQTLSLDDKQVKELLMVYLNYSHST